MRSSVRPGSRPIRSGTSTWRTTATAPSRSSPPGASSSSGGAFPAAKSIAVGGGRVYVLTALFNAVGEYSYTRRQAHGLRRELPGSVVAPLRLRAALDPDRRGDRHGQFGQPDRGGRVRPAAVEHRAGLPQRDRHPSRAGPPSIFRPAAQRRGGAVHAGRRAPRTDSRITGARTAPTAGAATATRLAGRGRSERRRRLRADGIRDGDRPSRPRPRRPRPGCRPAEHPLPPPPVLHLREEARRRAADRRSAR